MTNTGEFKPEVRRLAIKWFLEEFETSVESFEISKDLIKQKLIEYKEAGNWLSMMSNDELIIMIEWIIDWETHEWWAIAIQLMELRILKSDEIQWIYLYMQYEMFLEDKKLIKDLRKNSDLLDKHSLEFKKRILDILDIN